MQTTPSTTTATTGLVTLFRAAHQEALTLDIGVLEKVLRANHSAQRRTKYFQRLQMACRYLCTSSMSNLFDEYQALSKQITETVQRRKKQKKRQEVFWDFGKTTSTKVGGDTKAEAETQQLATKIAEMKERVSKKIPQAISRLEHASQALFLEMARGFFLPLCTICVACVARIRVLLQRLGSQILYEWPAWERSLMEAFGESSTLIRTAVAWNAASLKELQESFHPKLNSTEPNAPKRKVEIRGLLKELCVDVNVTDRSSLSNDDDDAEPDMDEASTGAVVASSTVVEAGSGLDLGERLSTHAASTGEEEECIPDYMQAAVDQVQSNLAFTKKALKDLDATVNALPPPLKEIYMLERQLDDL